jgi:hypothetical protein
VRLFVLLLLLLPATASAVVVFDKEVPKRDLDRLVLNVGGFIQPRFVFEQSDDDVGTPGEVGFQVARARVELAGRLEWTPDNAPPVLLTHKLSVEFMPEARLIDAYLDIGPVEWFRVRFGQFKAPTHRSMLASDRRTAFTERSALNGMIPRREMGVQLNGFLGRRHFEYAVGAFNGEGRNRLANVNDKFLVAARVAGSPWGSPGFAAGEMLQDGWRAKNDDSKHLPTLTVGYSIHWNIDGPSGQEQMVLGHNAELFFHYRWVTFQGEFLFRAVDWQALELADYNQIGGYGQVVLFPPMVPWVQEHLAVMFRFQQYDRFVPTELDVPLVGAADENQAAREMTLGLAFYTGEPAFLHIGDLRVQLEYTFRQELEDQPYKNDQLVLGVHVAL